MADLSKTEVYKRWVEQREIIQSGITSLAKESKDEQNKRIERARKDYNYFVSTYFSHLANAPCAKFHIDAARYLKNNPNTRAVFEWARGHAKSTHLDLFIPLWLKIQQNKQINYVIIVGKSNDSAMRQLSNLQEQLQYNELFIHDFGKQVKEGSWAEGEFVTSDKVKFMAVGRGQSPRGPVYNGHRPDYIIIDDLDDDVLVQNPRRVGDMLEWVLTALLGAMDMGRGRFVLIGNRIGKDSVLTRMIDRPHVYHTVVNAIDRNGVPAWKEKYNLQEILTLRETMGERHFQKEYMNNPMTEGAIFMQKHIHYEKILPLKEYRQLICYTDPSFKASSTADFKATMLVGKAPDGHFHIIKAFADQCSVSSMINWHYMIMDYIQGRVPVMYYMEANFMQDLMLDEFQKVGNTLGYHVPVIGDKRAKGDKFSRIESMQPLFERGLVVFNEAEKATPGMKVLEEQLLLFEKGSKAHDDAPDALESAIWMLSRRDRTNQNKYVIQQRPSRRW